MSNGFVLPVQPQRLQQRLGELEQSLLRTEGLQDLPCRTAIWAELATLYTRVKQREDARVCWVNALWDADLPPPAWMHFWLREVASVSAEMVTSGDTLAT